MGEVADVVRDWGDGLWDALVPARRLYRRRPALARGLPRSRQPDAVWAQIEGGAGTRLHYSAFQIGDVRCNRTAYGVYVGDRYVTLLDEDDPRDRACSQAFIAAFGGMDFDGAAAAARARVARGVAATRGCCGAAGWARRAVARAGGLRRCGASARGR